MNRLWMVPVLLLSPGAWAQFPASQPASAPASAPVSQPSSGPASLPAPRVLPPEGELEGWDPERGPVSSAPVEEEPERFVLPPPVPPTRAQLLGSQFVGGIALGFVGGAVGTLAGVFVAAQDNNLGAAREEAALGFGIGTGLGAGLGIGLASRAKGHGGSRSGAIAGGLLASGAAIAVGLAGSQVLEVGLDEARLPVLFFFALPYAASVGGALAGYELLPWR